MSETNRECPAPNAERAPRAPRSVISAKVRGSCSVSLISPTVDVIPLAQEVVVVLNECCAQSQLCGDGAEKAAAAEEDQDLAAEAGQWSVGSSVDLVR